MRKRCTDMKNSSSRRTIAEVEQQLHNAAFSEDEGTASSSVDWVARSLATQSRCRAATAQRIAAGALRAGALSIVVVSLLVVMLSNSISGPKHRAPVKPEKAAPFEHWEMVVRGPAPPPTTQDRKKIADRNATGDPHPNHASTKVSRVQVRHVRPRIVALQSRRKTNRAPMWSTSVIQTNEIGLAVSMVSGAPSDAGGPTQAAIALIPLQTAVAKIEIPNADGP